MKGRLIHIVRISGIAVVIAAILFIVLDITLPVQTHIDYGQLIRGDDSSVLHAYLAKDEQWRMKVSAEEITPELRKAIIFKEDKYFYYHPGVNLLSVGRAMFNNITHKKRTSGASTITMQVARMLQPKKRTYFNKVTEMFRALQLELHYTKNEILDMYLNLVPYGSNIQGVKAASILYFDKMPEQLSLAEITALSIIPNKPNSLVMGKHNRQLVNYRNEWLMRFKEAGLFSDKAIEDALTEPLTASRHDAPKKVPQFAWRMHTQHPGKADIYSTISKRMQRQAEDITQGYMSNLELQNIHNCAVIVIDNTNHEVKAYIGSHNFYDDTHHGQVDGVAAPRSPGSTLKPFLYALCTDMGMITPKTIIADVPVNLDGYMPENYDLEFRGNIAIEDALKKSLNIPAVKLLNEAGTETFIRALSNCGVSTLKEQRKNLGISLILGGCTIRLDELAGLYSTLANKGEFQPMKWTTEPVKPTKVKPVRLVSPAAAYIVSNIITDLYRPDVPNLFDNALSIPKIAWKTGTSYGRKDAWSVGYNKRYTIGVWVGNFDGTGVAELNGAGIATPLLFRLFNTIDKHVSDDWLKMPEKVQFRYVCKETGKTPNDFCTETIMDYYIPGISDNNHCDHLKEVWLAADESFSYCTSCRPSAGYKTETIPNISAELTAYYEQYHIPYTKIPEHNPLCSRTFDGQAPYITSLTDKATYLITDKNKQQLQLQCTAGNDVKKVFWYINDKYLTSTDAGERVFFVPETPNIKISCADDKGRNKDIYIKVKFI